MEGTLERDNGEITSPSIWPHAHTGTGPVPTKPGPAQEFSSSCAKPSLHLPLAGLPCVQCHPGCPVRPAKSAPAQDCHV